MKKIKSFEGYEVYDEEINRFIADHQIRDFDLKVVEREKLGKVLVIMIYEQPVYKEKINLNGLNK